MADFSSIKFQPNRPLLRELSADRLNTMLQEIRRNKPKGERGITVRQDGTGTYIGLAASLGRAANAEPETHPFQISSRLNPDNENQYFVTVRPGTVNNVLANNNFDENELRTFTLAKNTLGYAIATATTNNKQITSVSLSVATTAPASQNPTLFTLPSEIKFTLGAIYNSTIYQIIKDNISVSGKIVYTKEKAAAAAPGELPFEVWYIWQ